MNGQEYDRLFKMAREGRDAALACREELKGQGRRLDTLEKKVDDNNMAVAVGRFGVRAAAWAGTALIALGGLLLTLWAVLTGGANGPG